MFEKLEPDIENDSNKLGLEIAEMTSATGGLLKYSSNSSSVISQSTSIALLGLWEAGLSGKCLGRLFWHRVLQLNRFGFIKFSIKNNSYRLWFSTFLPHSSSALLRFWSFLVSQLCSWFDWSSGLGTTCWCRWSIVWSDRRSSSWWGCWAGRFWFLFNCWLLFFDAWWIWVVVRLLLWRCFSILLLDLGLNWWRG